MKLKEIRYNFIDHKATIIMPYAVEAAAEIADGINRYFVGGEVECEGYSHYPRENKTDFDFAIYGASLLDTLIAVFENQLTKYVAI